jgi:hypothetical protein
VPNGAKKREKGGKGGDEKNALLIGLLTEVEQILTAPQKDKKKELRGNIIRAKNNISSEIEKWHPSRNRSRYQIPTKQTLLTVLSRVRHLCYFSEANWNEWI